MNIDNLTRDSIKQEIVKCLSGEGEIRKIVIFGSFIKSCDPHDIDIAVFEDSADSYLTLALKYRQKMRLLSHRIPVDVFPLRTGVHEASFLVEVEKGEVIYEK
ncbi:MAG: hypothetical protein A2219_03750 [Elusimicrobia bacterium RIFOXYA2_FULL_50_26]|nr:MAG: hypothetical protein A2219_03750 [Elusimicrobia bacterium RIFOXYA2_FULL_50_26]